MYLRSRVESARVLINDGVAPPGLPELTQAGGVVEKLLLDELDRFQLSRHVLSTALRLISAGKVPLGNTAAQMTKIMGYPADERGLRLGLEKCLREIAHLTRDGGEKIRLVDEANSVRPRSLM